MKTVPAFEVRISKTLGLYKQTHIFRLKFQGKCKYVDFAFLAQMAFQKSRNYFDIDKHT